MRLSLRRDTGAPVAGNIDWQLLRRKLLKKNRNRPHQRAPLPYRGVERVDFLPQRVHLLLELVALGAQRSDVLGAFLQTHRFTQLQKNHS